MNAGGLAHRIRGLLVASIDEALQALRAPRPVSDEAVHDARKAIKKARAALRLLREGVGEADYRSENAALRDAGRYLAPVRDTRSLIDAFDAVRKRHAYAAREIDDLVAALNRKHLDARRKLLTGKDLQACMRTLAGCRQRVRRFDVKGVAPVPVARGIERIHRKGRKSLAAALRAGSPEALHEWRKQVKYLLNALGMLDAPDRGLAQMAKRAGKLADLLGDDHDLAELDRHLAASGVPSGKIARRLARRRGELQKKAWARGARVYDIKPAKLAKALSAS